jgi:hypothetical protein
MAGEGFSLQPQDSWLGDALDDGEFRGDVVAGDFGIAVGLHVDKNMSLSPSARESRSAMSAVIARLPCTMSLMRRGATSIALGHSSNCLHDGRLCACATRHIADSGAEFRASCDNP